MKFRHIILALVILFSAALQALGVLAIIKLADTNSAYEVRRIALRHLPYVSGSAEKLGSLTTSDSCAILTMPSFFGGLVSDQGSDTLVIDLKSGKLFFSLYPASGSDKQHETIFINNVRDFKFRSIDSFIYFELVTRDMERTFNFYRSPRFVLLEESGLM